MAQVLAVVRAIATNTWRELRSIGSITGQNLFIFLVFVALEPQSAAFFGLLLGLVVLFPLSTDPFDSVPRARLHSWPLSNLQLVAVRLAAVMLNPAFWIAVYLSYRAGWKSALTLTVFVALIWQAKRLPVTFSLIRFVPGLYFRGLLRTLDFYVAALLSLTVVSYRFWGTPLDADAPRIMSLVVVLALSTTSQVMIGLDGEGAALRYHLLPSPKWTVLLTKDLGLLAVTAVLTAPLNLVSGCTAMLAAMTVGHYRSIKRTAPQTPWRFTAGVPIMDGILQTVLIFSVGSSLTVWGWRICALAIPVWLGSIFIFGWLWDRPSFR